VVEVARKYRISEKTFYRWKSKYVNMDVKNLKRIKDFEKEKKELASICSTLSFFVIKELAFK
jgi:putative transposase